ncbi:endonuclease [Chryseobacterium sp.]|uniref:endonuclease/exonuclease/phosphatase family protein n=1 Tax=Chryseobacterium sp. TaxID=1871047 RepID=UPI00289D35A7|nr:endonuclease [Chryseobacterium sp.]
MMELFAFYNVENLFLPDPPPLHRLDPTRSGLRNWDERKYRIKLSKIAHVFRLMKEQYGVLPCIIGLCEISGRKVLEDLLTLDPFSSQYGILHYNSLDERKVDVALIYDKSKIEVLDSEPITFFFEIVDRNPENYDTTRDVLFAKLNLGLEIINVFVAHLPSKREKDINLPKRNFILNELRSKVLKIMQTDNEKVIVCGDFNENPDEENLVNFLFDNSRDKVLRNPFQNLYSNKKYSTFHYKSGLLFDQIILSENFFDKGTKWQFYKADVFSPESIRARQRNSEDRPFRTFAGTRYLGGFSDHYPVLVSLKENLI